LTPRGKPASDTIINAEAMGWSERVGSIDNGRYADLIAVAGDPFTDITEFSTGQIRDEGWQGHQRRKGAAK
jgi:imidazolonepropionase-like amidohydrolase